jgi:predicted glycosyltransferase
VNSSGDGARVLIYSHDTFGLGHLRRCRTIAHALVEAYQDLSVLILSGSPIIGSFDFRARVDFVRIPGVIKLRNGKYTSLSLHIDIEKTLNMRSSIIKHTAEAFDPAVFIVDKEPLGLRGEVEETLHMLKERGTHLVLGLRDVLDEAASLGPEWHRKKAVPALRDIYDEIWIYGLPQIWEPLTEIGLPKSVRRKITYTGYLPRSASAQVPKGHPLEITKRPYILVTTGGGGDGEDLIEWVLRAYESDAILPYPALLVLGPFMQPERQTDFMERAGRLERVEAITFDPHLEILENNAAGVVSMGGYNTFCEVLSMDKRAIMVPRTVPRREQYIRVSRAEELGMVRMLVDDGKFDARTMADALRALPSQKLPSDIIVPGLLEGLVNVNRLIEPWITQAEQGPTQTVVPYRA